jgi:hypothetical protein
MTIDDVRSQYPSNQHQKTSPNNTTPPAQDLDQEIHEEDVESNDQAKRRAMIKEEMRIKEKHHHIQECVKMFKEITMSTTYLVILKKG